MAKALAVLKTGKAGEAVTGVYKAIEEASVNDSTRKLRALSWTHSWRSARISPLTRTSEKGVTHEEILPGHFGYRWYCDWHSVDLKGVFAMKTKRFLVCIAAITLLSGLAACSNINQSPVSDADGSVLSNNTSAQSPLVEEQDVQKDIRISSEKLEMTAANLPEQYQITYEVDNIDGTPTIITQARDTEGNMYIRDGRTERWFLSSGTSYIEAKPNQDGILEPIGSSIPFTEQYVEQIAASFWRCAGEASELIAPSYENSGTKTVAGRMCTIYTHLMGTEKMNVTHSIYIDQETGICLGKTEEAELGIFTPKPSVGTFICTEFSTEDIVLFSTGD